MATAAIKKIASYFPKTILTNDALVQDGQWKWSSKEIQEKTGISFRYVVERDECASDLAIGAANKLFADGNCFRQDIEFLIFCSQSPDYFLPSSACMIQEKLGLKTTCGAIDINQGCSGYIYGLALAKGLIESQSATNVLLLTAETYSKFINPQDRSTRTIFCDGAAATLLTASGDGAAHLGPFVFGTDGKGAQNLIVPAGGMRRPLTPDAAIEHKDEDGNIRSQANLFMNGPEIFNFTLKTVPKAVESLLSKTGKSLAEVDYFVFHQANKFMLEKLRNKLKIPEQKFWIDLEHGNTVSASIPIALENAIRKRVIKPGDEVMLAGFGVGYSWAATMTTIVEGDWYG